MRRDRPSNRVPVSQTLCRLVHDDTRRQWQDHLDGGAHAPLRAQLDPPPCPSTISRQIGAPTPSFGGRRERLEPARPLGIDLGPLSLTSMRPRRRRSGSQHPSPPPPVPERLPALRITLPMAPSGRRIAFHDRRLDRADPHPTASRASRATVSAISRTRRPATWAPARRCAIRRVRRQPRQQIRGPIARDDRIATRPASSKPALVLSISAWRRIVCSGSSLDAGCVAVPIAASPP